MTHFIVASNARHAIGGIRLRFNINAVNNRIVAVPTGFFGHTTFVVVDQNLIREVVRGECKAVKETVACFAVILIHDRIVGRMAVIASRD